MTPRQLLIAWGCAILGFAALLLGTDFYLNGAYELELFAVGFIYSLFVGIPLLIESFFAFGESKTFDGLFYTWRELTWAARILAIGGFSTILGLMFWIWIVHAETFFRSINYPIEEAAGLVMMIIMIAVGALCAIIVRLLRRAGVRLIKW